MLSHQLHVAWLSATKFPLLPPASMHTKVFSATSESNGIVLLIHASSCVPRVGSHMQNALDLDVLAGHQRQTAAQARSQPASTSAATVADSTTSAAEEALWLQLLAKMTGHVVTHLPKIWQLTQVSSAFRQSMPLMQDQSNDLLMCLLACVCVMIARPHARWARAFLREHYSWSQAGSEGQQSCNHGSV